MPGIVKCLCETLTLFRNSDKAINKKNCSLWSMSLEYVLCYHSNTTGLFGRTNKERVRLLKQRNVRVNCGRILEIYTNYFRIEEVSRTNKFIFMGLKARLR